jgi:uncharacterized membrane protein YdjX (TVP38/TMEM64 family)
MSKKQLAVLLGLLALIAVFFLLDLGQYFNLEYFKANQARFDAFYQDNPLLTIVAFFAVYVAVTGLSLPGAAIMTLVAGALFGLWTGTLLASFASSLGATLAFLFSRYILRDSVQNRFAHHFYAAPGAGLSFFRDQPGHGPDAHPDPDVLLGEPGRDAGRHRGIR